MNIIENSRKGAAIDSAYGYKDAISKYYITELAKNPNYSELNGNYTVNSDGSITGENEQNYPISFSGTSPKGGSLTIDKGTVTEGCLTIGDYALTLTNSEVTETKKGDCSSLVQGDESANYKDNIKFPEDENETYITEVYLDPTNLETECTEEKAKGNSTTGTKEGCMRWFVYDDEGENYTMILDHNTTNYVAWVSKVDYENDSKAGEVGITYSGGSALEGSYGSYGNNNKGPLTVLAKLKEDTSNWKTDEIPSSDNYTATWNYSGKDYNYTVNYNGYKARLITAEEVAKITKNDRSDDSYAISSTPEENWGLGSGEFLLDRATGNCYDNNNCDTEGVTSKYWWLFDNTKECTTYGCKTADNSTLGYWTSSPHAGGSSFAWEVYRNGRLGLDYVRNASYCGVRPVITVSKSKFLQE